jgi:hypothetical protein
LDKIKAFLEVMVRNEAICTFKTNNGDFRFSSVDQIRRSVDKISVNNVTEKEKTYRGVFTGALPVQRRFEFKVESEAKDIGGRILPEVVYTDNPEKDVADEINKNLNKPVMITVILKIIPVWEDALS